MVQVRPERHAALCSLLADVLRDTFEDALVEIPRPSLAVLSGYATGTMDAVLSTVYEALAAFARDRNAAQPDPVAALPPELVSEIFRHLDFSGRITASHVCTSWRSAALADCALWAEYSISVRIKLRRLGDDSDSTDARAKMWEAGAKAHNLSVLLARSNPLPFRLNANYVPDTIAELVIAHKDRMEDLRLDNFQTPSVLRRLFAQEFPILKSFSCHLSFGLDDPPALSPLWADASCLEHLEIIGRWRWTAGCAFRAVVSFTGSLPEVEDAKWRTTNLFPNLNELCITGIPSQVDVDVLDPLPPNLVSMGLTARRKPLDYSNILARCKATGLRMLVLSDIGRQSSLHEATKLFVRTFTGKWALGVTAAKVVLSSLDISPAHHYTLHPDASCLSFLKPEIFLSLDRVCELDISLSCLQGLWTAVPPGASLPLPSLNTLRIDISSRTAHAASELANGTHIDAPALIYVSVSVSTWDLHPRNTSLLAVLAPVVRAFRAAAPVAVNVYTDGALLLLPEKLVVLKGAASCLTLRNHRGEAVAVYPL